MPGGSAELVFSELMNEGSEGRRETVTTLTRGDVKDREGGEGSGDVSFESQDLLGRNAFNGVI